MKRRPRMAAAPRFGLVVGLAAGLSACANVWGFDDLTTPSPDDASPIPTKDGGDGVSEGSAQADSSDTDDGSDATLVDVQDAGPDGSDGRGGLDAGDGARSSDAASDADADDGAAMAQCMTICGGCCDSQGICQKGTAVSACGTGGKACLDCPVADKCTVLTTSCCNNNACACATVCGL
jgi:hypothetical protein